MAMKKNRQQLEEHVAKQLVIVMDQMPYEIERLEEKYKDRPVPEGYPDDYQAQAVDAAWRVVADLTRMRDDGTLVAHVHRFLNDYPIMLASPPDKIAFAVYSALVTKHHPFK